MVARQAQALLDDERMMLDVFKMFLAGVKSAVKNYPNVLSELEIIPMEDLIPGFKDHLIEQVIKAQVTEALGLSPEEVTQKLSNGEILPEELLAKMDDKWRQLVSEYSGRA